MSKKNEVSIPLRVKINLYPAHRANTIRNAIIEAATYTGIIALIASVSFAGSAIYAAKVDKKRVEVASVEAQVKSHQATLAKIDRIDKASDELKLKIKIIDALRRNSSVPVRALDAIAFSVDPTVVWLTDLHINGSRLTLNGVAADNQTVADFSKTLQQSPLVTQAEIDITSQAAEGRSTSSRGEPLLPADADFSDLTAFTLDGTLTQTLQPVETDSKTRD